MSDGAKQDFAMKEMKSKAYKACLTECSCVISANEWLVTAVWLVQWWMGNAVREWCAAVVWCKRQCGEWAWAHEPDSWHSSRLLENSRQVCWSRLEINFRGEWVTRTRVEDLWFKVFILKPILTAYSVHTAHDSSNEQEEVSLFTENTP